ncbi:MAG: sulfurtransferase TusA family protein [Candidatus Methanodesulfokora washburnensis]|jgi:TusA-related sulfurtransferase|uniref:Sulfurtransferase TusA family protein n=1 Tax=Candidatus Methanodesulfokora washburnensis TaxID=2478471 RepID=A0A429GPS5_9CREN|nr:sulfurtransferase TusA family protein [Candidatus Methanodesulfokores washburnensis]RSN75932.1 sulfurtransferase TusA family protein [Candidatus Methanodesulfokores washburnensis]
MKRGTKFLDLRGQKSPFALIRIAKEVKKAKPDEILEFLVDDPATVDEIAPWSERTGNKIISMKKEDSSWIIRIRRRSS